MVSVISLDVKGAYSGVFYEKLRLRLQGRGILEQWIRWIIAFCLNRRAPVLVNGEESEVE